MLPPSPDSRFPSRTLSCFATRTVSHTLFLLILGLELPLHGKVELALALDTLLLHVADHALVHCLWVRRMECQEIFCVGYDKNGRKRKWGAKRTACSASCWWCTKATVARAKREVPRRVSFDARDMVWAGLDGWMVEWWVIAGAWLGSVAQLLGWTLKRGML